MARSASPVLLAVVSKRTCPEMTSIGIESRKPPTTPVMAFVPPGPVVTQSAAILLWILA